METEIVKTEEQTSPLMPIIQAASTNNEVDADKLMKLLEANEKYEANEARKAYHVAMSEFHKSPPKIAKDKQGHNCTYAGLSTVVSAIAPILSANGLSHSWVTDTVDESIKVTCRITHIQGHSEEVCLSAEADTSGNKNSIQALGSTVTYLQRYTLKAALGLAEEEQDDDGAGSGGDPNEIPAPTETQEKVLTEICNKMLDSASEKGITLDTERIDQIVYGMKGEYPNDIGRAGAIAAHLVNWLNEKECWPSVDKDAR